MKQGKRIVSLILALVMICGLMVNASAAEAQEIKAQLSYDITVSYNGEAQTLTDAAGNIVYPISYNGTTYLPVRAVSYVLGIAVDWDGATQTVLLSDGEAAAPEAIPATDSPSGSKDVTAQLNPGITVKYNGEVQTMTDAAGNTVYPVSYEGTTYLPVRAVSNMLGVEVDWDGATQTVLLSNPQTSNDTSTIIGLGNDGTTSTTISKNDVFRGLKTSEDAKVFGENHIGYDWVEIDWSTVSDSYVRVIVNELPEGGAGRATCRVSWDDNGKETWDNNEYTLTEGEWNIPLFGGSTEYVVTVNLGFFACEHYMTDAEKTANDEWNTILNARFNAEITNTDKLWVLSTPAVDFEHAPNTQAKALEITQNYKTDAEKITAVFNWVSRNIEYKDVGSNAKANKNNVEYIDCFTAQYLYEDGKIPSNVEITHINPADYKDYGYTNQNGLDLDLILSRKTGVCAHYAALTAGMLRSLGIPCKVVTGYYQDSNGELGAHAWVAVKPETGSLNMKALGAGNDYSDYDKAANKDGVPTGWIRLDPTNAHVPTRTADDSNYTVLEHH